MDLLFRLSICILFCLTPSCAALTAEVPRETGNSIHPVSVCDIIENPNLWMGKSVSLTGWMLLSRGHPALLIEQPRSCDDGLPLDFRDSPETIVDGELAILIDESNIRGRLALVETTGIVINNRDYAASVQVQEIGIVRYMPSSELISLLNQN